MTTMTLAGMPIPVAGKEEESIAEVIDRVDSYLTALNDSEHQDA